MISSFVGLVHFGKIRLQATKGREKSLRELSIGNFEAYVRKASVSIKHQETGKTSWTTYCSESL